MIAKEKNKKWVVVKMKGSMVVSFLGWKHNIKIVGFRLKFTKVVVENTDIMLKE